MMWGIHLTKLIKNDIIKIQLIRSCLDAFLGLALKEELLDA